jgi:two-component system, NarL family, invasion response regulator UvrY
VFNLVTNIHIQAMTPKILIADDHVMIRKGTSMLLEHSLGYKDITESSTVAETRDKIAKGNFSHLILDISFGDSSGLELLPWIREEHPELQVLIFSMQPEEVFRPIIQRDGVYGFLSKQAGETESIRRFGLFLEGKKSTSPNKVTPSKSGNPFEFLSGRETAVLLELVKGKGTKEISNALDIRMNTVSTLKARIFEKTGTKNTQQLIDMARLYEING